MIRVFNFLALLLLAIFTFVACGFSAKYTAAYAFAETKNLGAATDRPEISSVDVLAERNYFTVTYYSDIPYVLFELTAFMCMFRSLPNYHTVKITIRDAANGEIIQEIIPSDYTACGGYVTFIHESLGFVVEDMNFDGYADIRIAEFLPVGPNIPYLSWVWDREVGRYVFDSVLSSIPSLEVDHENQIIRSFNRVSAGQNTTLYYQYIGGILTLVKEITSIDD